MKKFLTDAKLNNPKCLIYLGIGSLQIIVASPETWAWPAVALAALISWKTFLSDSNPKINPDT